jgi:hypothetical protein
MHAARCLPSSLMHSTLYSAPLWNFSARIVPDASEPAPERL